MFCDWSGTFDKWEDENLYQKFCESREVIASIVWRIETVQLANRRDPNSAHLLTLHFKWPVNSGCVCGELSVL